MIVKKTLNEMTETIQDLKTEFNKRDRDVEEG